MLVNTASRFPDRISFRRRRKTGLVGITYRELKDRVDSLIAGLVDEGLKIGDRVTFLCDASPNWMLGDQAIIGSGGVCVPRGTDVTDDDIIYIVTHSGSKFAIVQREKDRKRLKSMSRKLSSLKHIYVLEGEDGEIAEGKGSVRELMEAGRKLLSKKPDTVDKRVKAVDPNDLATLIYTSGTTGSPKGVMLNQTGWLNAVTNVLEHVGFRESDRVVSLLPPWHAFERGLEYGVLKVGMDLVISDISVLKDDLAEFKPTVFPSVPRIWESVYNGIMAKIKKEKPAKQKIFNFFLSVGGLWARNRAVLFNHNPVVHRPFIVVHLVQRLIALIVLILISPLKALSLKVFGPIHGAVGGQLRISVSGGSALPGVVDKFLSSIGILVVEGYGMTETSAVISIRPEKRPTSGTVGAPLRGYEIRIKDEKGNILHGPGQKGTLWVKSNQILMGYYKRPELNRVVFDKDGFFDTGDIMMVNYRGELMFAGRAKDTIALAGGENVEPVPIEDRLLISEFIDQVMVVGDDRKTLGALIVPNFERVAQVLQGIPKDHKVWNLDKQVRELFRKEVGRLVSRDAGFKIFEMVPANCFYIVPRQFDPDTEMTRTLKMKRPVIKEHFAKEIDLMFK